MGRSDTVRFLETASNRRRPTCRTCNSQVDSVSVAPDPIENGIIATIRCHGSVEYQKIGRFDIANPDKLYAALAGIAFLRTWAGYTIRPVPATGRRL